MAIYLCGKFGDYSFSAGKHTDRCGWKLYSR